METKSSCVGRATTTTNTIGAERLRSPSASIDMIDFPTVGSADVAVFWDFENVRIPAWCPATTAAEGIRRKVAKYGRIVEKRLYYDSRQPTESSAPRSELDLSGFTLVDCPSRNRKETLDKKLIVDVLCFAWERASMGAKACVVLITSDGDYSYALARLRDIGVFTIVIYRPDVVAKVLIDNANVVMSWEFDVLGGPPQQNEDEEESESVETANNNKAFVSDIEDTSELIPQNQEDPTEAVVKQPTVQARGKFALFCSVVLNAQHRNVQEGISVYSSWAEEAMTALTFYAKIGAKDREGYHDLRTLASQKGFIEWGRRNLCAAGKPVIKVKDRNDKVEGLSLETYLRLTYSGLAVVKPNLAAKESDWTIVLPKMRSAKPRQEGEADFPVDSSAFGQGSATTKAWLNGKLFVGGLAWQTTEDSLRSYFIKFGSLAHVIVMEGRGFGFVFFRKHNDAENVMKMAGQHVVDHRSVE